MLYDGVHQHQDAHFISTCACQGQACMIQDAEGFGLSDLAPSAKVRVRPSTLSFEVGQPGLQRGYAGRVCQGRCSALVSVRLLAPTCF